MNTAENQKGQCKSAFVGSKKVRRGNASIMTNVVMILRYMCPSQRAWQLREDGRGASSVPKMLIMMETATATRILMKALNHQADRTLGATTALEQLRVGARKVMRA